MVALGIAIAAILMFIGTGGAILPQIIRSWVYNDTGPNYVLLNALLLNIALIVFGLRRYRELMSEIEHRRDSEERARILAETDPLTGCLNRRSVTPATDELIANCADNAKRVAFMMVDLDNFKQVNDLNGHKVGDQLLVEVANRMRNTLPDDALLARLGGDEFACVVAFDKRSPDAIDQLASELTAAISRPHDLDGVPLDVTISLGVATSEVGDEHTEDGKVDGEGLLHRADIAMYQAKKQGKNRHFWFDPTMETDLRFRKELETALRRGLEAKEFVPFYEQQIDIETGEIVGFEMLARWKSAELGLVRPNIFIPVAEEIGLIGRLSEQLISAAMEDAKEWAPHLTLSVNISPVQLRDPWFAQRMLKLLTEQNFPAERLEIEITESCLHENIGQVRSMITSLKNQGVKISLDDFGTGYSSLAQLRSLPFDRLKIDRSFVGELNGKAGNEKLIDAIIQLGEGLQLPVTAEGIEDNEILQALQGKGRLKGQGYFYGQPEDAAQVRERLAGKNLLGVAGHGEATLERAEHTAVAPEVEVAADPQARRQA
ncbi:putative bifunctional diguanylate cyclase/phosphodiesterase [Erythrobacter sp. HKB08]|uniref:putative bifunctional diguanylate cyclase/phosphodiesterase n=1 Tax=Erythrobacter sp. HKB08 TaxID=2502843 RepID=UPI003513291C